MPSGGKRQGAGRKSSWTSGCRFKDTRLIRVPSAIADEVLEYAHKLDKEKSLELNAKLEALKFSHKQLADRLNVDERTIDAYREGQRDSSLEEWSKFKDPEGISWRYDPKLEKYIPVQSGIEPK